MPQVRDAELRCIKLHSPLPSEDFGRVPPHIFALIAQLGEHHSVFLVVGVSGSSPLWGAKMPYDGIGKWMITYILLFGCHTLLNYRSCRFVVESFVTLQGTKILDLRCLDALCFP